jgi:two-component system, cell cycle response regulator DivK
MTRENREQLILIVDDDKDIRNMYTYFLQDKGFRVASVADGKQALDQAVKLQPDLILMDLSLPEIGGWAAIKRLKRDEGTARIPIVVLTAHSLDGQAIVSQEGCEGFLIKPCLPTDLLHEIVRVLGHRTANRNAIEAKEVMAGRAS